MESAIHRATRRLLAAWLASVLVGDLDVACSLVDAELWFTGTDSTCAGLPLDCARHAHEVLKDVACREGALAMLPYALDPIPHEYRLDVLKDPTAGASRAARKDRGSFFTPVDVVDHIVDLALDRVDVHTPGLRVLDPAAGTGAFLRSAFGALLRRGVPAAHALDALHGIDIDECCVDMAAFVLLVDYVRASGYHPRPSRPVWSAIRSRLVAADTLAALSGVSRSKTLFDRPSQAGDWLGKPFDVIVGNPPYASVGEIARRTELGSRFRTLEGATPATDIYPAFVELLCSTLTPNGAGSMVVPMSIGYASTQQFRRIREVATHSGGHWTFEFYDRTPDALFGDDVKQRAAIVTRAAASAYSVTTSPVLRWTSRNRSALFARVPRVELGQRDITSGVPKLGSRSQAEAFEALRSHTGTLRRDLRRSTRVVPPLTEEGDSTVYVAGTAYNWLNVYRAGDAIARGVGKPTTSPLLALTADSRAHADALYALLSSRIAFWMWRVESDVFHVPMGWVTGLPLSPASLSEGGREVVGQLGRALWDAIAVHPIVSVNGGRTTLSYCPHAKSELLDQIDQAIIAEFGLPTVLGAELAEFVRDLTTAGRDGITEHGLRRALASWREGHKS
jgi:hypothetical protein